MLLMLLEHILLKDTGKFKTISNKDDFQCYPSYVNNQEKSGNNENLAIWLNPLKLGNLQTPQGKKTLG